MPVGFKVSNAARGCIKSIDIPLLPMDHVRARLVMPSGANRLTAWPSFLRHPRRTCLTTPKPSRSGNTQQDADCAALAMNGNSESCMVSLVHDGHGVPLPAGFPLHALDSSRPTDPWTRWRFLFSSPQPERSWEQTRAASRWRFKTLFPWSPISKSLPAAVLKLPVCRDRD